jgi:tetratricopeptide (TPR) repeat protein
MTRQQLEKYMAEPGTLDEQSLPELIELAREFPYFQTAWMLIAKNLKNIDHLKFPHILRTASAYAGDRKVLKRLIDFNAENINKLQSELHQGILPDQTLTEDKIIPSLEIQDAGKPHTNEDLAKRTKNEETSEEISDNGSDAEQKAPGEEFAVIERTPLKSDSKTRREIIDKFIREQPRISQTKHEFFNPIDMAKQSSSDHEEIVTETLGEIYASQGLTEKAIKIFEKLIVIIPEKSSYFAARIKDLQQIHK